MCTSDRCGSAACMRRLAGSWINSDDRCAASATTTKEGTTGKCYPSPEYNLLPITWTVQLTETSLRIDRSPREVAQPALGTGERTAASVAHPKHPAPYSRLAAIRGVQDP